MWYPWIDVNGLEKLIVKEKRKYFVVISVNEVWAMSILFENL